MNWVHKTISNFVTSFIMLLCCGNIYGQKAVLSSRWFHPIDKTDTLKTLEVLRKLKPERIDWTYCDNLQVLKQYQKLGVRYSLAMNPQIPDSAGFTTAKYRIKTILGTPYVASWMKNWKITNPYWGCVNNPLFKELFLKRAIQLIDLKSYGIFVDDALFNVQLQKENQDFVGCVCPYCLNGFHSYRNIEGNKTKFSDIEIVSHLKNKSNSEDEKLVFDYKQYQRSSVVQFLKNWKTSVKQYNKRIKIITNNYRGDWSEIYSIFDGGIAEIQEKDLNYVKLDSLFKISYLKKKSQIFTLVSSDERAQNYLLAYLILKKKDYLIPWDQFVPGAGTTNRYYANTDKLVNFIKFLKKKNTVIKYGKTDLSFNKKMRYGVTYDSNKNINYVTLYK